MVLRTLVERHLKLFVRDRWAVFFSLLSILIVLMLFMLFLREAFVLDADIDGLDRLVHSWIISGVLMLSTVTVPLGFLGIMIRDIDSGTINDFLVAPIKRSHIVLSYLLAALLIGTAFSTFNLVIGQLYMFIRFGFLLAPLSWLWTLLVIVLATSLFASLFFFIVTYVKTPNAHGTMQTLVGTLIGFLVGLYVPLGNLGNVIRNILSALPTLQVASLFRIVYMADPLKDIPWKTLETIPGVPYFMRTRPAFEHFMGVKLELFGQTLSLGVLIVVVFAWVCLFTVLSTLRIARFKTG